VEIVIRPQSKQHVLSASLLTLVKLSPLSKYKKERKWTNLSEKMIIFELDLIFHKSGTQKKKEEESKVEKEEESKGYVYT
jgi:hypothetical protein